MHYKYYLAPTSQMHFCSVPLRLDSYSNCQFGCQYCFSKARGGAFSVNKASTIDNNQLRKRLMRASRDLPRGATEEFLQRRVPIQFGGMNDPFGPAEKKHSISLETLKVLAEFDYPTLISTKGTTIADEQYLSVLRAGNFYVRISIAAVTPSLSCQLEAGVPTISERMKCAEKLASAGVPVSLRLQPIVPGFESAAATLISSAYDHGFKHISAEYLKLPMETGSQNFAKLESTLTGLKSKYTALDAVRIGREYILPIEYKKPRLVDLKNKAQQKEMIFGFAENELLLQNDFIACCNASDRFLRGANFFEANIASIVRKQLGSKDLRFIVSEDEWTPSSSVFSHLNSRSRPNKVYQSNREAWLSLIRSKWNANAWRGGPASFDGILDTGTLDANGNRIFRSKQSTSDTN